MSLRGLALSKVSGSLAFALLFLLSWCLSSLVIKSMASAKFGASSLSKSISLGWLVPCLQEFSEQNYGWQGAYWHLKVSFELVILLWSNYKWRYTVDGVPSDKNKINAVIEMLGWIKYHNQLQSTNNILYVCLR